MRSLLRDRKNAARRHVSKTNASKSTPKYTKAKVSSVAAFSSGNPNAITTGGVSPAADTNSALEPAKAQIGCFVSGEEGRTVPPKNSSLNGSNTDSAGTCIAANAIDSPADDTDGNDGAVEARLTAIAETVGAESQIPNAVETKLRIPRRRHAAKSFLYCGQSQEERADRSHQQPQHDAQGTGAAAPQKEPTPIQLAVVAVDRKLDSLLDAGALIRGSCFNVRGFPRGVEVWHGGDGSGNPPAECILEWLKRLNSGAFPEDAEGVTHYGSALTRHVDRNADAVLVGTRYDKRVACTNECRS